MISETTMRICLSLGVFSLVNVLSALVFATAGYRWDVVLKWGIRVWPFVAVAAGVITWEVTG
jgi:hypothetical protein